MPIINHSKPTCERDGTNNSNTYYGELFIFFYKLTPLTDRGKSVIPVNGKWIIANTPEADIFNACYALFKCWSSIIGGDYEWYVTILGIWDPL